MSESAPHAVERLELDDAIALATALSHHIAQDAGVRTLVIKGPLVAERGLRPVRTSHDVDLLVDPDRFDALLAAFAEYGWIPRPTADFPILLSLHSRTLVHPRWNCDIDVHHYWPGFLAEPHEAFEHLWQRREAMRIADVAVDVPSLADSALVLALHSLREAGHVSGESRQLREYRYLCERVREDDALVRGVMAAAVDTDATQTARPFLQELGFQIPLDPHPSEQLRRWNLNVHARNRMTGWMLELREAPFWRKPRVLFRAVFPTAAELRAIDPTIGQGIRSVSAGWWRRFVRGVTLAPETIRDLKAYYTAR